MLKIRNIKGEKIDKEISKTVDNNISNKISKLPILNRNKKISTLIVKKMNENEKYTDIIKNEINDYFNSPEKYFTTNSPITVNKKIRLKKINLFKTPNNVLKYKYINQRNINTRLSKKLSAKIIMNNFSKKKSSMISSLSGTNIINNLTTEQPKNYEIVDNNKLKNIFKLYQDKKSNLKEEENKLINNIPIDITESLSTQSRSLKNRRNHLNDYRRMAGFLSQRSNKTEKDLLINSIDTFRYKKEIIDDINFNHFNIKNPIIFWKMNLRRSDNDLKENNLYLNIKNDNDPLFAVVTNSDDKKELKFKSGTYLDSKELKSFKNNKYLIKNYANEIKRLEKLKSLNVRGRNIFKLEYKREMNDKKRKILHRVFVENGKQFPDTEINDIFGEQTIYKNYLNEKNKYDKLIDINNNLNTAKNSNTINEHTNTNVIQSQDLS